MLPPEAPVLFGLHPNAEIGYLSNQADSLLRDIIALGGFANEADDNDDDEAASGSKGSSGSSIGSTLSNLLSRLPEPFEMISIGEKSEPLLDIAEKGPFVIVAMQECTRMNVLINEIRRSLIELEKGLSGALNMSESMEDLVSALTIFQVPGRNPYHKCSWENLAWWSKKGLESWFSDMLLRITQLSEWSDESFHTSEESDYAIRDSEDSQDSFTSESFMTHSEDDEFGEHVTVHAHHGVCVATKHWCIQTNLNESERI